MWIRATLPRVRVDQLMTTVLEVPGADLVRERPRHGGVGGRCARTAAGRLRVCMFALGFVVLGYFFSARRASTCGARAVAAAARARCPDARAGDGNHADREVPHSNVETAHDDLRGHGGHVLALRSQAVTVQYPDRTDLRVQDTLPFRYRGILEVDLEICTGCLACERACPIDCIVIEAKKDTADQADDPDPLRHRHRQVHVLRAVQRAVPDRLDPSHAGVRGRRLLAREHDPPLREGAGRRLQAEETAKTDPAIAPILERGMRYLDEFASPEGEARRRPTRTRADARGMSELLVLSVALFYLLAAVTVVSARRRRVLAATSSTRRSR